jgi:hypothetical protein
MLEQRRYLNSTIHEVSQRYLKDFEEFIFPICLKGKIDQQLISKESYFYQDNTPYFNMILRFESLESDFGKLCNRLSISQIPLLKLKSLARLLPLHYSKYYTPYTQSIVQDCYCQVINFFGYKFERI